MDLWLRGRWVRVWGWVERADREAGILSPTFCIERVEPLDQGPEMFWFGSNEGHEEDLVLEDLYANEAKCVEEVFWFWEDSWTIHEPMVYWEEL